MTDGDADRPGVAVADGSPSPSPSRGAHGDGEPLPFGGILWPSGDVAEPPADPPEFHDLHLHRIVASVLAGREAFGLAPLFRVRASDVDTVAFRHEVFRDLARAETRAVVDAFAVAMHEVRERLDRERRARYPYERASWRVAAARRYCAGTRSLHDGLVSTAPRSRGLRRLAAHVGRYVASEAFGTFAADAEALGEDLAAIRFRLRLEPGGLAVSAAADEPDFGAELLATFERFRQGPGRDYRFEFPVAPQLNHVEAAIVDRVALVHPELFARLWAFTERYATFIEPGLARFDREAQFYLAWLEHMARIEPLGVAFSLPDVALDGDRLAGTGLFDLALAESLLREQQPIVVNDVGIRPGERIIVVTGPNQGGKSTFARTLGQLHHLAALGLPVPGRDVRITLVDGIHTLFDRRESVEDLVSKLEMDLRRTRAILDVITRRSLVVMNETFSSTTVADQAFINDRVVAAIEARGAWCVIVTFLDELAARGPSTVSMVSEVEPDDTARRTYRIRRRPADGLAYALGVAQRHGLTYDQVRRRIAP